MQFYASKKKKINIPIKFPPFKLEKDILQNIKQLISWKKKKDNDAQNSTRSKKLNC